MHEKLKFSFGHVLAFLALLFIGYIIFTGVTYFTKGSYVIGGIVAGGIMAVLLLMLFRLQMLKATNQKIEKRIVHERVLVVFFILFCGLSFVAYSHFWTVKSKENQVVGYFNQSIQTSRQLFADYQTYSAERMAAYSPDSVDEQTAQVLKEGLRLQLTPQEYTQLRGDVGSWLDKSEQSISIWNVFLAGNIDAICRSMRSWQSTLNDLTVHRMNDESSEVTPFNREKEINASVNNLLLTKQIYSTFEFPKPLAWVTGILCFAMLFLPWLIQRRSPKSLVTLWGKRKIQYDSSKADQIERENEIEYDKKGDTLERVVDVETNKKGLQLDRNEGPKTTGRKAMTLTKPSEDNE